MTSRKLIRGLGLGLIGLVLMGKLLLVSHANVSIGEHRLIVASASMLLAIGISGAMPVLTHAMLAVFFYCSTAYSLIQLLSGERHCDCFGVYSTPLWLTLTISAILAGLLSITMQQEWSDGRHFDTKQSLMAIIAMVALVLIAGVTDRFLKVGRLTLDPATVSLKSADDDYVNSIDLVVKNSGLESVTIVGASRSCRCSSLSSLPVEVAPKSTANINVAINSSLSNSGGGKIRFHTTSESQPFIDFSFEY